MPARNFTKPFSLVGLLLGEIYMFYTVLAPYHQGPAGPILYPLPAEDPALVAAAMQHAQPLSGVIMKLLVCGVFFGIFGALVGLGFGLLATGLFGKPRPPAP